MTTHQYDKTEAVALEFAILTVTRTSETLKAQWSEIDWGQKVWVVPAERMKLRKEHRVPLSSRLLDLLNQQRNSANGSRYIFPRKGHNKPLPEASMRVLLRKMGEKTATVHGYRSSFSDWAYDTTDFAEEIIEGCMAHQVGNASKRAYRRQDALAKRRALMQAWSDFCGTH